MTPRYIVGIMLANLFSTSFIVMDSSFGKDIFIVTLLISPLNLVFFMLSVSSLAFLAIERKYNRL
jgi:hypothetical protein